MFRTKALVVLFVSFLVFSLYGSVSAANRDVCSVGCSYSSIQSAISAASSGDVIRLAQGKYFERVSITSSASVTIQGGWNSGFTTRSSDPSLTVIDGLGLGSVFYIYPSSGATVNLTIDGLTITGGLNNNHGGGVYAFAYTDASSSSDTTLNLILTNNIITKNEAYYNGGGIYIYASTYSDRSSKINLTLTNNKINQNEALYGGGIYITGYTSTGYSGRSAIDLSIEGNEINGNVAGYGEGGIYTTFYRTDYKSSFIKSNKITGNTATYYGGVTIDFSEGTSSTSSPFEIINNLVATNWGKSSLGGVTISSYKTSPTVSFINNTVTANNGVGLWVDSSGESGSPDNFTLTLKNNIIKGNVTSDSEISLYNYSNGNLVTNSKGNLLGTSTVSGTTYNDLGNLTGDPTLGEDFHLKSGSSCINFADATVAPATDIDGHARVGAPDSGAFEYQGSNFHAQMTPPSNTVEQEYPPTKEPVISSSPLAARPLATGNVEGGTLSIEIALPQFTAGVDAYVVAYAPSIDPVNLFFIAPDLSLHTLASSGPVKWKSGITSAFDESIYGDIPLSSLLKGKYYLSLIVTPQNTPGMAYYRYDTYFVVQ